MRSLWLMTLPFVVFFPSVLLFVHPFLTSSHVTRRTDWTPKDFQKQVAIVQFVCFVKQLLFWVVFHSQPNQIITNSVANGVREGIEGVALSNKINGCMA